MARKRDMPPVVGTAEAAEILQVEPSRLGRWIRDMEDGKKTPIPEPVRLKCGPVWFLEDIERAIPEVESRRRRKVEKSAGPEPAKV